MEERRKNLRLDRFLEFVSGPAAVRVLTILGSFLSGFLFSRGLVFGRYAPFGPAIIAVVPKGGLIPAAIGAILAYIIPSATYVPVRYIGAVLAVAAIRWSLSELKRVNNHPMYSPIITFIPLLATGLTMALINKSQSSTTALYLAETFLAAGCAYFFNRTVILLTSRRSKINFDPTDIASFTVLPRFWYWPFQISISVAFQLAELQQFFLLCTVQTAAEFPAVQFQVLLQE